VILINLLPHRELARKRRRASFNRGLGLAALLGGMVAALVFIAFQAQISAQQQKNQLLQTEITRFDAQIKDIASLQTEITALRARQQAVEDLQADRNLPVFLLTELVRLLPEGVFIASLRQDAQALTPQSDFAPFVAREVAPEVRNAAMKKLFTDPHYQVMDRLDTYIDDYSQADPIPESMLRQMASAKFLQLFEDAPEAANPDTLSASPTQEPGQPHDHTDLRLQPNDAAGPQEPGCGAQ
jgi:hypothetical protein